ncbi:MAG: hypothetical protein KGP12_12250 [Actinomycetales bacterium]|nr:hypothetical protein [Actinomycetales bacterium]
MDPTEHEQTLCCHRDTFDVVLIMGPQELQVHQVVCSLASGFGAGMDLLSDLVVGREDRHRLGSWQAQLSCGVGEGPYPPFQDGQAAGVGGFIGHPGALPS